MSKRMMAVALLCCSTLVFGFLGFGSKKDVVATVGRTKITNSELQTRLATFPPQYSEALKNAENKARILDQMIDEQVFLEAAKKAGYAKDKEFRAQMEAAEKQLLMTYIIRDKIDTGLEVTPEEVRAYFNNNPAQFAETEQRRLRHILVETESEANAVVSQLRRGADFAALAREKSKDATAQAGGELGWVQKGQLVPEFEAAAFAISRKGQISGVVQTQFGFHVIELEEVNVRPQLGFEQVSEQIRQLLVNEKKRAKTAEVLAELKKSVKISRKVENIK
jgi:peptidyl-prolyl cis-trans isomerase C